jgi:hypothetical protein
MIWYVSSPSRRNVTGWISPIFRIDIASSSSDSSSKTRRGWSGLGNIFDRAEPTPVNFATKGFDVAACPWNVAEVAAQQLDMMINLRQQSNPVLGERFRGVIATVWTGVDHFLKSYYDPATYDGDQSDKKSDARTLKSLLVAYKTINNR